MLHGQEVEMEWQPIETAPKDGTEILVRGPGLLAVVFWGDINAADSEYGTVAHEENYCWLFSDGHNDPFHYRAWPYLTKWMLPPA